MILSRCAAFGLVVAVCGCGSDQEPGVDFDGGSGVTPEGDSTSSPSDARTEADAAATQGLPPPPATTIAGPVSSDAVAALGACYKGEPFACEIELGIVRLVNEKRTESGKDPMATDESLSWVARSWSTAQVATGVISHTGFPLAREAAYRAEFGGDPNFFIAGENVGTTYGTQMLAAEVLATELVSMWWSSKAHRANLLGNFRLSGIGVVLSADKRTLMATQIFAQ